MRRASKLVAAAVLPVVASFGIYASAAQAAAVIPDAAFQANTLAANDDGFTSVVPIGFDVNFFGNTYNQLWVNNNGNVTFDQGLSEFTPFGLTTNTTHPIIAAFFADVDTRGAGSGLTQYGQGTVDGHTAFGVDYINVGYFGSHTDKLNSFQLLLIDRSDTGAGNFDIEFNYDQTQWETGDASGGSGGLGGSSARVGYSNGSGNPGSFFELAGSGINGAFLDGGPNALISHSLNSDVSGRYIFQARNGEVIVPTVPLPAGAWMALSGLAVLGSLMVARRRKLA
jgi:hypothetical protein